MMDIIASQSWAYIPDLPDDIGPIRNLLLVYSRIPASDIDSHILRVVSVFYREGQSVLVG